MSKKSKAVKPSSILGPKNMQEPLIKEMGFKAYIFENLPLPITLKCAYHIYI